MIQPRRCDARLNLPLIRFPHVVDDVAHARGVDHVGDGGDACMAWRQKSLNGNPQIEVYIDIYVYIYIYITYAHVYIYIYIYIWKDVYIYIHISRHV